MRFVTLTYAQMLVMAILVGLIASAVLIGFKSWHDNKLLPQVFKDANGLCVKVVNFENGHAFGCPDVDVLLRRYVIAKDAV